MLTKVKKREESYTGKYSKGLRNQNEKDLVNICESKILEIQVIQPELYLLLKVASY